MVNEMSPSHRVNCRCIRCFARDTSGAFLPEFSVTILVFLSVLFGLIFFGRMAYGFVMVEKAVQVAARIAAVRPPVCAGVPVIHEPASNFEFGTRCIWEETVGTPVCADGGTQTCSGATVEIWNRIAMLMPTGSTPANLSFTYDFDHRLGFLGGPYVPMVTVELTGLQIGSVMFPGFVQFLTGANNSTLPFPAVSSSMPGEDLAQGTDG